MSSDIDFKPKSGAVNARGHLYRGGRKFESTQLHQVVCTSWHDFLRHRIARHSRGLRVAGRLGEVASARASPASGVPILIMPMALGTLADGLGLRLACLLLLALPPVAALCFVAARAL